MLLVGKISPTGLVLFDKSRVRGFVRREHASTCRRESIVVEGSAAPFAAERAGRGMLRFAFPPDEFPDTVTKMWYKSKPKITRRDITLAQIDLT